MVGFDQESRTPKPRMKPVTTFSDPLYLFFPKTQIKTITNEDGDKNLAHQYLNADHFCVLTNHLHTKV
jgi:hypothetical protein